MASPSETAALVVSLAEARPPTCGTTRLVCVDGPAGSGKTTLGTAVAELVGAQLLHGDDLMSGWRGLSAVGSQLAAVVGTLCEGRDAAYDRWDWHLDAYATRVPVPRADWLVVEGVGSGSALIADWTTLLVWVEVGDELRLARGLARDGVGMSEHWQQFMLDERALFAADRSAERADVLVDGTGSSPPLVRP
jgi:cytidylate kinase